MNIVDIPLREKPSHGAVKRVQRIEEDWMLKKIGLEGFRQIADLKKTGEKEITKKLLFEGNPDLFAEFLDLQERLGEYQTIMLCTGWNLQKMLDFEVGMQEEISEEEYQALLNRCIETLGGTAADFFGTSNTGSSSQTLDGKLEEKTQET